ncbi:MAG TPA: putative DNA modification/repair radical SAM protein [Myxococcota bacterium]
MAPAPCNAGLPALLRRGTLYDYPVDLDAKLAILADAAKYDASCASSGSKGRGSDASTGKGFGSTEGMGICHSYTPDGRCVSLLKVLLTNACRYDCQYCINRVSSDVQRTRFSVDELVMVFIAFYKRNYVEGLFLSSGIPKSPDDTMEEMLRVVRSLREEHHFHGYIHIKAVPGASQRLLDECGRLVDRISANIELPTEPDLKQLAPDKSLPIIESTMTQLATGIDDAKQVAKETKQRPLYAPAGQSTQLIVGATPTTDQGILTTSTRLYAQHGLRRVYYSAYSPIQAPDARLPPSPPDLLREHRLYQADWLLRFYGFSVDEIAPLEAPTLSRDVDPKLAWALRHRGLFPLDVNVATMELLLRVPGFGTKNVDRLIVSRRHRRLRLEDLKRLRVNLKKAQPFIVTADHNPATKQLDTVTLPQRFVRPAQLTLFDASREALSGQL